jgi:DNA-binding transcriptional MerR regulator
MPIGYDSGMLKRLTSADREVLGRGVYGAGESLRLLNFRKAEEAPSRAVSRQTVARWLRGYDYHVGGELRHSDPLWRPDYANDDGELELSFRDLIELRFVKAFRDLGLSLPMIRECFRRAAEEVKSERPFSTRKFRTDGKRIFLDVTADVGEGELIDLKRRQMAFRTVVEPSLRDLEFEADRGRALVPPGLKPLRRD